MSIDKFSPKTARYVGRFSLPRIQSHHRKKIKPRQKNPRLSDYLEEYDEVSQVSKFSHNYVCVCVLIS